jgi:hypothetical protein
MVEDVEGIQTEGRVQAFLQCRSDSLQWRSELFILGLRGKLCFAGDGDSGNLLKVVDEKEVLPVSQEILNGFVLPMAYFQR